jgi:hypothetical protein
VLTLGDLDERAREIARLGLLGYSDPEISEEVGRTQYLLGLGSDPVAERTLTAPPRERCKRLKDLQPGPANAFAAGGG